MSPPAPPGRAAASAQANANSTASQTSEAATATAAPVETLTATAADTPTVLPAAASPAQRRLNFLLQASVHLSSRSLALSRVLQQQLQEVARRHVLRLHASVKHSCCSSCFSLLLPQNTSVRQFVRGGCSCCRCINPSIRTVEAQRNEVRASKRETPEAPASDATEDASIPCNDDIRNTCGAANSSGASSTSPDSCCVASCGYCSCCCPKDPMRPWRGRRRGRRREAAGGQQQERQQGQQQPLMEVRCRVCGFVSRRP